MSQPTDPQSLLNQAKCFLCLGVSLYEALQLALLAEIVNNGGGGGGSTALVTIQTTDPPGQSGLQGQLVYNTTDATLWLNTTGTTSGWQQLI